LNKEKQIDSYEKSEDSIPLEKTVSSSFLTPLGAYQLNVSALTC